MLVGNYRKLYRDLSSFIPEKRLISDELGTLAYGTDASFYRLIPKLVVRVESEEEVIKVLSSCRRYKTPITFRAAGTSLSGQSITDSVLVILGFSWNKIRTSDDASKITLQPGVIGAHANRALAPFQRKIGPDPASINSAMIGGIAANNASGMCCGIEQNSYHTLASMKIIFSDGSILNTASSESRKQFIENHPLMISRVGELAERTKSNQALAARIRRKYKMKNTTGYSLNALIDFDDPIDIIQHLMIGSEGTLGFIAEITYRTILDFPFKATALVVFPNVETACHAVATLAGMEVSAVELMDRASLRSVESKAGVPEYLKNLEEDAASLLVEVRREHEADLQRKIDEVSQAVAPFPKSEPLRFTSDKSEHAKLWNVRKGLFPSVGAMREAGTSVVIEDVAFPVNQLAGAVIGLQNLFKKHGYHDAILFGHALQGNLHFVFQQDFNRPQEILRYQNFIDDLTQLVVRGYDGSLKAEHGTGRNMAPFVEMEWGLEAYELMREIKEIFDPENLINPGVILNNDPKIHLKNLKPLPKAHPIIDKCIECGFCEVNCPSRELTLTPRQRIVIFREVTRLVEAGEDLRRAARLKKKFEYQGNRTCATDGLCAMSCPVGIDTGRLIKAIRFERHAPLTNGIATWIAKNTGKTLKLIRILLDLVEGIHRTLGTDQMTHFSSLIRKASGYRIPQWNSYLPKSAKPIIPSFVNEENPLKAVYFPSCVARTMGMSRGAFDNGSQTAKVESLLRKAGFEVIYPSCLSELCCGLAFASKGFSAQADIKVRELEKSLREATKEGQYPILFDTSPCLYQMREMAFGNGLRLFEPVEFIQKFLLGKLKFNRLSEMVAIHATCSIKKMGLDEKLKELAELCAEKVIVADIGCCGFAGDVGLTTPELAASALGHLKEFLPSGCEKGYSTSRTCEIGLSLHSGISYQSIAYLVDQCTEAVNPSEEMSLSAALDSLGNAP